MSEEVKIKISQPMFEVGELERFDNNIHSIVEKYSKLMFKEKDQILTQRIIMKQEEEIEQLTISLQAQEELTMNEHIKVERLHSIIKEVREILKFHLSNPSGTKNGWHIDIWNSEDISKLNEDLGILDKGE